MIDDDANARDPLRRAFFAVLDSPGHGTSTGSVIAGRERGEISGVAPGATLVPFRAIKSVVQVLDGDVARAVNLARERGCDIISMSLGGRGFIGLQEAIRAAVADGLIVMAAAGNKVSFVVAPASYPECLAVAATNCDSEPWPDSSRGAAVDISAPGESVWAARVELDTTPPGFVVSAATAPRTPSRCWRASPRCGWRTTAGAIRKQYGRANVQSAFLVVAAQPRTPGTAQLDQQRLAAPVRRRHRRRRRPASSRAAGVARTAVPKAVGGPDSSRCPGYGQPLVN